MKTGPARGVITPLRLVYFAAGVALLILLLRQVDLDALAQQVLRVDLGLFLLGGLIYLVKSAARAARVILVLDRPRPRFLAALRITLASSLAVQLLPFKLGELAYVYLVRRENQASLARGVSSLMLVRVFDLLAIALLFLLSALLLGLPEGFSAYLPYLLGFVGAILVGLAAVAAAARFFPGWIARAGRLPLFARFALMAKARDALLRLLDALRAYGPRQAGASFALAMLEWLVNYGVYHVLLIAIGLDPHPFDTTAAVTFAALASVLPVNSLGSFGTQEAGWATGLILLGYPRETAITSGFATHLLQVAYMLALGGLSWLGVMLSPTAPSAIPEKPPRAVQ